MAIATEQGRRTVDYGKEMAEELEAMAQAQGYKSFAELARQIARDWLAKQKRAAAREAIEA